MESNLESPKIQEVEPLVLCRICLQEEVDRERLISPCLCKGSMKYVHQDCLNHWRLSSPNPDSVTRCDSCKMIYKLKFRGFAGLLFAQSHERMPQFLTVAIVFGLLCTSTYVLKIMELFFKIAPFTSLRE